MTPLPCELNNSVSNSESQLVNAWWEDLSPADQKELTDLCHPSLDTNFFAQPSDEEPVPKVSGGYFVPHDDAWGYSEWGQDMYEYLLQHPEVMLITQFKPRTFYFGGVCTSHSRARETLQSGCIPRDFNCPLANLSCPLRQLIARGGGQSLTLCGDARSGRVLAIPLFDELGGKCQ